MSNTPLRFDSLLVRTLATDLDRRLAGGRLRGWQLDSRERRLILWLHQATLTWHLHPARGWPILGAASPPAGRTPWRRARLVGVTVPADERWLDLQFRLPDGATARLVVELLTNQWNAIAVDPEGRIEALLQARRDRTRTLRVGLPYTVVPGSPRAGSTTPLDRAAWLPLLRDVPPPDRPAALIQAVAFTSPINAAHILGPAAEAGAESQLAAAYHRYRELLATAGTHAYLLTDTRQPYPHALGTDSPPRADLWVVFSELARRSGEEIGPPVHQIALERVRRALARARRRASRLRQELAGAKDEARRLRWEADLLLSQLAGVPRGARQATLDDFSGGSVVVTLDPALSARENADRRYGEARRRERAATVLPKLLARVAAEVPRLTDLADRLARDQAAPEELERWGEVHGGRVRKRVSAPLPYRRYRTTSGLEVRVGRNRRDNDALTFHHSHPNDVWLHARAVAGAHVVLRWSNPDAGPPGPDLVEAAVLAAVHSRSRTSGTVAVDWTRRKYVRKPRKAPPGQVVMERARTVFVVPDPDVVQRLRIEDD